MADLTSNTEGLQAVLDMMDSRVVDTSQFQPKDADLTAIAGLTGTKGFLKKTAADKWALDTSTYLTTTSAASTYLPLTAENGKALTGDLYLGENQDQEPAGIRQLKGTSGFSSNLNIIHLDTDGDTWIGNNGYSIYLSGYSLNCNGIDSIACATFETQIKILRNDLREDGGCDVKYNSTYDALEFIFS